MKAEFIINYPIDTGYVMVIQESDFRKAAKDRIELNNMFFAVDAFNKCFGIDVNFGFTEYKDIEKQLEKGGTVIFSVTEDGNPCVYVSNRGILKPIMFTPHIHAAIKE